jgi:hypothetical protein
LWDIKYCNAENPIINPPFGVDFSQPLYNDRDGLLILGLPQY